MSQPVIRVENLCKRYILGHQRSKDDGFRHVIEDAIRAPLKWLRTRRELQRQQNEEFWALTDVSFDINQGDVVGIIGRNGAGKSTLLKILSRITEPTSGRISIDGRVASLLEVGTGFHPELTGRENIFLNGAILGMSRVEIKRRFDEIVAFSEVEKFLDTPVKRYSSGMYVRLAFSVAAHLEPEILIVDEVLAVGDAQFQTKCMGKMNEVARGGRTVLFVSHSMIAVRNLCDRCIMLEKGRVKAIGTTNHVISSFMHEERTLRKFSRAEVLPGDRRVIVEDLEVSTKHVQTGAEFRCVVFLHRPTDSEGSLSAEFSVDFVSDKDAPALMMYSGNVGQHFQIPPGKSAFEVLLPELPLAPGRYSLVVWVGYNQVTFDVIKRCYLLDVDSGSYISGVYIANRDIPVVAKCHWTSHERLTTSAT